VIKAVFFDMYGTLAGFEPSRFDVQTTACADFGITLTPKGILKGYASADEFMVKEAAIKPLGHRTQTERESFFAKYERLVLRGSGIEISLKTASQVWDRLRQIPYKLTPFEDVEPVLTHIKSRGLITGMISNIDQDGENVIDELGISHLIDLAVTSIEAGAAKPDPAIFLTALSKAGVTGEEAVHVGDQPSSDIEGAFRSGINAILIDRDGNHPEYSACPRIETLLEVPNILKIFKSNL